MKKIVILFLTLILVMAIVSCSKDHDAPTFSKYSIAKKPTAVEATYSIADDAFDVSWQMSSTKDVVDYYVAISDSADFNGVVFKKSSGGATTFSIPADFVSADVDTMVWYFAVHAIYSNEDLHLFIGPRSDSVDSAMFVRSE